MCEHNKNEKAYCAYCAVSRVRELHKPFVREWDEIAQVKCSECNDTEYEKLSYPCPTIKALDGEK